MKHEKIKFQPLQVWYVMIHVIEHDMDPNSNINYRRKIPPVSPLSKHISTHLPYLRVSSKQMERTPCGILLLKVKGIYESFFDSTIRLR